MTHNETTELPTHAPPRRPRTRTQPVPAQEHKMRPIGATANGPTGDDCCHWYRSTTQTFCGIIHEPIKGFHQKPPCPNGNPPCSRCVEIHDD